VSERVPLSFLLAGHMDDRPPVEPVVPFAAMQNEDLCIVTAVLERTAICGSTTDQYARLAVRHENVMVDPDTIEWKERGVDPLNDAPAKRGGRFRSWRSTGKPPGEARAHSDERAKESKKRVEAAAERELAAQREESKRLKDLNDRASADSSTTAEIVVLPTGQPEVLKLCRKCGREKPLEAFAKNATTPDGRQTQCRECMKAYWSPAAKAAAPPAVVSGSQQAAVEQAESKPASEVKGHPEPLKFCPGCKQDKPKSAFPTGSGFFKCNECRAEKASIPENDTKAAEARNRELAHRDMKHCPRCKQDKPREAFNRNSSKGDGLQAICRQCQSDIWTTGSTERRRQMEGEKPADIIGPKVTPPLTFRNFLDDLRQLSSYAAGLEQDNAALRAENEQLRAEQTSLYDELHTIVGGMRKSSKTKEVKARA